MAAVSREFRDYVRDLFAPFGEITIRLMFGGAGIYHKQVFFGLIGDEVVREELDFTRRHILGSGLSRPRTREGIGAIRTSASE